MVYISTELEVLRDTLLFNYNIGLNGTAWSYGKYAFVVKQVTLIGSR